MSTNTPHYAFFDLDGTITKQDTFLAFIRYTHGWFHFLLGCLRLSPIIISFFLGRTNNTILKERFFQYYYGGASASLLQQKGQQFAIDILPQLCRPGALAVLAAHKEAGHQIYIHTASADLWVQAWCQQHNYQLISSTFAVVKGRYTGQLAGLNNYGIQKYFRMKSIMKQYPLEAIYHAYGDTAADQHFLTLAQHAYCMPLTWTNIRNSQILPLP